MIALSTGDRGLAEDVTQEAMFRAAANWDRVSRLDRPDRWVLKVAGRLAIDTWRKRRRETSMQPTLESGAVRDEIRRLWLEWGLDQLTPSDRLLVILRHRDDLSMEEIAEAVHKTPSTVAVYLKRARRRLRRVLGENDA